MRFDPFEASLETGVLERRYKRFLADVILDDGQEVTVHCPNSGSMMGMAEPGMQVAVRHVPDPARKLKWTWELVDPGDGAGWVGCNTHRPNHIVQWAIESGHVPGLTADAGLRGEVKYGLEGRSRIDLLLGDEDTGLTYVEVKNTTLARDGVGLFPDAVTARGTKHMHELVHMVREGHDAAVVFLVNRSDCDAFGVARDIDPAYGAAFDAARDAGVQMMPLGVAPGLDGWKLRGLLPLRL